MNTVFKDVTGDVDKNPILVALGEQVRSLRARRGLTRKALALTADVSERHLANLESGQGNPSVLVLLQLALALQCEMAELLSDVSTSSPEWLLIRSLLEKKDEGELRRARHALVDLFATHSESKGARRSRIALIGLRGAGKSSLGRLLADYLGFTFVELSRDIEKLAGCSLAEIQALYGMNAYKRYERRALDDCLKAFPNLVIATPGGIVSDPTSFNRLLSQCTTVWLQAEPEEHMQRVAAQGDMRPIAASSEAMDDLRRILAGRSAFYSKADVQFMTSAMSLEQAFAGLKEVLIDIE
jgi:XRE family transcriptional regulator, aerobic/anaerobic benzoate catabolism transcriptional regulator